MRELQEFFQYNGASHLNEFSESLKKCEEKISRIPPLNLYIKNRAMFKPQVKGTRSHRSCKEQIYKLASEVARKNELSGNMISLGAAYALEIYKEFASCITDRFVNVEKDKDSYLNLSRYYLNLRNGDNFDAAIANLTEEDKVNLSKVSLLRGDIFNTIQMNRAAGLAMIDLDLMQILSRDLIDKIYRSLEGPGVTKNRFLLAVWSTYGRSCTEEEYDAVTRPYLLYKFVFSRETKYSLVDYRTFKYCDNRIPLKVELLVLENKKGDDVHTETR